jgi:uncharacterized protein with FMN-binding domain
MADKQNPSLLRQVAPAAILTATGVAFVSLLDNPTGTNKVSLDSGASATTTTVAPDGAIAAETTTTSSAPEVATTLAPSPLSSVVDESANAQGSVDNASPAPALATPATGCDGDVVTSPTAMFRWGGIQLQVSFSKANAICDVTVLQYPNDRSKSIYINQNALPVYNKEAVTANSASISAMSGATESWEAYTAALQAVLDSRK